MCDTSQINSTQNWLSNHSCSMHKSVLQCCSLFDRKCLLSFLKSCFYLFCVSFFVLFWRTSKFPSICIVYALILRDGFQQIIAKTISHSTWLQHVLNLPTRRVITCIMGRVTLGIKSKWNVFQKSQIVMLHYELGWY